MVVMVLNEDTYGIYEVYEDRICEVRNLLHALKELKIIDIYEYSDMVKSERKRLQLKYDLDDRLLVRYYNGTREDIRD